MRAVVDRARKDAATLCAAGVDALIVENYGDAPFLVDALPAETVAAMAAAACAVRDAAPEHPLGINCLRNDGPAAVAVAVAVGARFVRVNVHTGALLTDQGIVEGRAGETLRTRARLGGAGPRGVAVAADVLVKHATPLVPTTIEDAVRDAAGRGRADAVVVSGARTGAAPDPDELRRARAAAGRTPVLLGSGATPANAADLLPHCDGVIVGSVLERGGRAGSPVDERRAAAFVRAARDVWGRR